MALSSERDNLVQTADAAGATIVNGTDTSELGEHVVSFTQMRRVWFPTAKLAVPNPIVDVVMFVAELYVVAMPSGLTTCTATEVGAEQVYV